LAFCDGFAFAGGADRALSEAVHFAQTLSEEIDRFLWTDGPQKLHGPNRSQQKRLAGPSDRYSCGLSQCLCNQYPWDDGVAGKMAFQERFLARKTFGGIRAPSRFDSRNLIDKNERWPMR
jgi:hypothetical protein